MSPLTCSSETVCGVTGTAADSWPSCPCRRPCSAGRPTASARRERRSSGAPNTAHAVFSCVTVVGVNRSSDPASGSRNERVVVTENFGIEVVDARLPEEMLARLRCEAELLRELVEIVDAVLAVVDGNGMQRIARRAARRAGPDEREEIGAETAVDVAEALALGLLVRGDRGQRRVAVEVVVEPERPAEPFRRLRVVVALSS